MNGKKILLIEDEEVLSDMYEIKFKQSGFCVIKADYGRTGISLAEKEMPDIIVLDVIMPRMDGFSVLRKLKNNFKTKNIPVLILSNLSDDRDIKRGKNLGAINYLIKTDNTPQEVVVKINDIIRT